MDVLVWVGPDRPPPLLAAIERAGGSLAPIDEANAIVWTRSDRGAIRRLRGVLHPGIRWVQLDGAGIERWLEAGLVDRDRLWTAAKGAYGTMCAEHAVALVLAAAKRLPELARRTTWSKLEGDRLEGKTVGVVGAGGIGREVIARLAPFGVRVLASTRTGRPVEGAARALGPGDLDEILDASDYVVLAAPLTAETRRLIGARELSLIGPDGWLVNVSRGALVDTAALVAALAERRLGGACLDVTDPEPLPPGHPLWSLPNALVTPHVANTREEADAALAARVAENVRRFVAGRELLGVVDPELGY